MSWYRIHSRWRSAAAHHRVRIVLCLAVLAVPHAAFAQQTITEALTFLFAGRPLPVDPFVPRVPDDRLPGDALAVALRTDLGARPLTSPAGGLAYEWNGNVATMARPTESFGPVFTTRARATGARRASISFSVHQIDFDHFDEIALDDGHLVAAATKVANEATPFDVQSLSVRIRARTATFTGQVGVTDRLDFVVAVPFVDLTLEGTRTDTYRGTPLPQATAFASATGLGDVVMRAGYQILRQGPQSLAVVGEVRLPTGNTVNSLGSGERRLAPYAVGSLELRRLTIHAELGYSFGELADAMHYGGAVTVAPASRVTLTGEVLGRTDFDAPRLGTVTVSHPSLAGVSTTLLAGSTETTNRLAAVLGVKWNVAGAWLLNAHVVRPLTRAGFTAAWSPSITFDYFFQQ
jgi:hypothetical protein